MPFRTPLPHQIEALRELAALARQATGAVQVEICTRAGSVSRILVRQGAIPSDTPARRVEVTNRLPIGSELVVSATFVEKPSAEAQRALSQTATSATGVLGTSAMIEPDRGEHAPFALFDTAPMPMWIFDIETLRFLDVNAFAVSRYGFTRDEFLQMTVTEIRPEEDRPAFEERARAPGAGFSILRYHRHLWKNGQVRDVALVSYDITYQGRPARLVMVDDVTEQLRAERTKDLLLAAVENLEELVVLFQQPRRGRRLPRITFVNAAFERLFGWDRGHLLTGEGLREITSGLNDAVVKSLVEAMRTNGTTQLELDVHDREGRILRMDFTIVPVRTADASDSRHWVAVARDITQQKALADRSIQAQRLEAMGMLAGGIAHDFNNIVVAISGFTQLALKQLPSDSQVAEDIRQVHTAAGRAAALAQQLLAFSRQQEMSPQRLDVGALVVSLEPMLRRLAGKHIELTVQCPEQRIELVADRTQMEQVLLNLVVNARDAQPEGGRIDICVDMASSAELAPLIPELAQGDNENWVRLSVTDAGPGIPPDVRKRAFEPFYTTKATGTGLGLSTVHGIVRQSGGHIVLQSPVENGRGTRAIVILPSPVAARPAGRPTLACPLPTGAPVLVFSDDAATRRNLRDELRAHGLRVLVASNLAEAAKCLLGEDAPRVAVVALADRVKRTRALEQLRAHRSTLGIVVLGDATEPTDAYMETIAPPENDKALHDAVQRLASRLDVNVDQASSA